MVCGFRANGTPNDFDRGQGQGVENRADDEVFNVFSSCYMRGYSYMTIYIYIYIYKV